VSTATVLHLGPFAACVGCDNGTWTYRDDEPRCDACAAARPKLRRWTRAEKFTWWDGEWERLAAVGRTLTEAKKLGGEWWRREVWCPPWEVKGSKCRQRAEVLRATAGAEDSAA